MIAAIAIRSETTVPDNGLPGGRSFADGLFSAALMFAASRHAAHRSAGGLRKARVWVVAGAPKIDAGCPQLNNQKLEMENLPAQPPMSCEPPSAHFHCRYRCDFADRRSQVSPRL